MLVPIPILLIKCDEALSEAVKDTIGSVFKSRGLRITASIGIVEAGAFGSKALLPYGGSGAPVLRAIKSAFVHDQRSSWCEQTLAEKLGLECTDEKVMDGTVFRSFILP
jgi:hypothetical protein